MLIGTIDNHERYFKLIRFVTYFLNHRLNFKFNGLILLVDSSQLTPEKFGRYKDLATYSLTEN